MPSPALFPTEKEWMAYERYGCPAREWYYAYQLLKAHMETRL